ncbi:MAG: 6-phosphogluconolactonase [Saprospiraceae bacterium]
MSKAKYEIDIFENIEKLNVAAAEYFITLSNQVISVKGKFIVSLSGGETPLKFYSLLSTSSFKEQIQWNNIYLFWGDERVVPLDDPRNNAHQVKRILLDKMNIPSDHIHIIPVQFPPQDAAKQYDKEISEFFGEKKARFDLIFLGLGENGHTASLFPGTKVINEKKAGVRSVYVEEEKMYRITMTAPLINQAHHILFLVTGKKKASVLKNILKGPYHPDKYPAQLINPEKGSVKWFVDSEAASQLNS